MRPQDAFDRATQMFARKWNVPLDGDIVGAIEQRCAKDRRMSDTWRALCRRYRHRGAQVPDGWKREKNARASRFAAKRGIPVRTDTAFRDVEAWVCAGNGCARTRAAWKQQKHRMRREGLTTGEELEWRNPQIRPVCWLAARGYLAGELVTQDQARSLMDGLDHDGFERWGGPQLSPAQRAWLVGQRHLLVLTETAEGWVLDIVRRPRSPKVRFRGGPGWRTGRPRGPWPASRRR